jgi:LAO/AO transport system kinase
MVPGMGDDIQAIKAGILEIGDLFVVNKADRDGAERTERELMFMLEMNSYGEESWRPPVMKTEAQRGTGVEELVDMIEAHHTWLRQSGEMDRLLRDKHANLFQMLLKDRLFAEVWGPFHRSGAFDELLNAIIARTSDPYSAVEGILAQRLRD